MDSIIDTMEYVDVLTRAFVKQSLQDKFRNPERLRIDSRRAFSQTVANLALAIDHLKRPENLILEEDLLLAMKRAVSNGFSTQIELEETVHKLYDESNFGFYIGQLNSYIKTIDYLGFEKVSNLKNEKKLTARIFGLEEESPLIFVRNNSLPHGSDIHGWLIDHCSGDYGYTVHDLKGAVA